MKMQDIAKREMIDLNKKDKRFTRGILIIFILFIGVIIGYNYFLTEPIGELNSGLLILIAILSVLVLSESFDNFSVGKLLSISKIAEEKDKKIDKLENDKLKLFNQLITTISSIQSQAQQNTNIYGDLHLGNNPMIDEAYEDEVNVKEIEEQSIEENSIKRAKIFLRDVKPLGLEKYIKEKKISMDNIIKNAKFVDFNKVDPISNISPVYSAYYRTDDNKEIFVEFRIKRGVYEFLFNKIYLMLSKLKYYSMISDANVRLDLVWLNLPTDNVKAFEQFSEDFAPSIASGLLKISEITLTDEEIEQLKSNY